MIQLFSETSFKQFNGNQSQLKSFEGFLSSLGTGKMTRGQNNHPLDGVSSETFLILIGTMMGCLFFSRFQSGIKVLGRQ